MRWMTLVVISMEVAFLLGQPLYKQFGARNSFLICWKSSVKHLVLKKIFEVRKMVQKIWWVLEKIFQICFSLEK